MTELTTGGAPIIIGEDDIKIGDGDILTGGGNGGINIVDDSDIFHLADNPTEGIRIADKDTEDYGIRIIDETPGQRQAGLPIYMTPPAQPATPTVESAPPIIITADEVTEETSQPAEPIDVYSQHWFFQFIPNLTARSRQELQEKIKSETIFEGSGASGHTYRLKGYPDIAIKVFDNPFDPKMYDSELNALQTLRGSPHVAKLVGRAHPDMPVHLRYLTKEFIEGTNMTDDFLQCAGSLPLQGGENPRWNYNQQKRSADWFISALEGLEEFHNRGIAISDFKISDCLWAQNKNASVFIDLGNAIQLKNLSGEQLQETKFKDVEDFLDIFFSLTKFGSRLMGNISTSAEAPNWLSFDSVKSLEEIAKNSGATASLVKIAGLYQDIYKSGSDQKYHSAKEFADAMKTYFQEVGLHEEPKIVIE